MAVQWRRTARNLPMIIILEPYGRLGNRLFLSAYGMALAKASGQSLINLALAEYSSLFPATRSPFKRRLNQFYQSMRPKILHLKRFPIAWRWFVFLDRQNAADYSPDNPTFVAAVKRRLVTVIQGWPDPARISFPASTSDDIRETFRPEAKVAAVAQARVQLARCGADVLVGVHIRWGDYREYRRGISHYRLQDYLLTLQRIVELLPGKRVAFLVCSDEPQKAETFQTFRVTMGPGTLLEDLYSLAMCDYLVGPPSTYSLWAAFYGSKPLYHMVEPEPPADLSAFMIPDGRFGCIDLKLDDPEVERRRRSRSNVSSSQFSRIPARSL
jgi:hypothetical protein